MGEMFHESKCEAFKSVKMSWATPRQSSAIAFLCNLRAKIPKSLTVLFAKLFNRKMSRVCGGTICDSRFQLSSFWLPFPTAYFTSDKLRFPTASRMELIKAQKYNVVILILLLSCPWVKGETQKTYFESSWYGIGEHEKSGNVSDKPIKTPRQLFLSVYFRPTVYNCTKKNTETVIKKTRALRSLTID